MHPNAETIKRFYAAFAELDPEAMAACYADDVRFDVLWSNPPIRVGKAVLHALLRAGLGRLAPDGHAVLVVHKHLGSDSLQRWLVDQGFPTERLVSRQGYRLLRVLPRTEASP